MTEAGYAVGLLISIPIPTEVSSRTPNALEGGSGLLFSFGRVLDFIGVVDTLMNNRDTFPTGQFLQKCARPCEQKFDYFGEN